MLPSTLSRLEKLSFASIALLFFSLFSSASGIALGTTALFLCGTLFYRLRLKEILRIPLFWPIAVFCLAVLASVAFASGTGFSKPVGKLRYFLFYFYLVLFFADFPLWRERLLKTAIYLAIPLAFIAALQFTGVFCPLVWTGATAVELAKMPQSGGAFFHARGLLYHHNPFAYTCALLYFGLAGLAFSTTDLKTRYGAIAGTGALLIAIALSGSRGAWISVFVGTLAVFCFAARSYWKTFLLWSLGVVVLAGMLSATPLGSRLMSIRPAKNSERLHLWHVSWKMFLDSPWVGQGYHHGFELQRKRFMSAEDFANPHFPTDPHSLYFDLLGTTGILGLGSFLALLLAAYLNYFKALQNRNRTRIQAGMLITGLGAWVCFTVGSAFDSHFFHTQTLMATLFFLALGQSAVFQIQRAAENTRK